MTEYQALIDEYLAGPGLLRQAVAGMNAEQLDATPVPGKWSTRQVICHIADFEPVYADRMKRVIAEHEPTMFGGDPDVFAAHLAYDQRDVEVELAMIEYVRRHVASILQTLPAEALERRGIHSEAGPLTLAALLQSVTRHIPHHLTFIREKRQALGI